MTDTVGCVHNMITYFLLAEQGGGDVCSFPHDSVPPPELTPGWHELVTVAPIPAASDWFKGGHMTQFCGTLIEGKGWRASGKCSFLTVCPSSLTYNDKCVTSRLVVVPTSSMSHLLEANCLLQVTWINIGGSYSGRSFLWSKSNHLHVFAQTEANTNKRGYSDLAQN